MKKNFKKLTAVALTAAMTFGSALTAFAADTSGDVTGDVSGSGSYEGEEIAYPTIKITVPTVPEGIDYIADPNDLIKSTLNSSGDAINEKYDGYTFNSATGVYFKTTQKSGDVKGQYTEKSAPMTITNQNAQNLKIKVKLAQSSPASGDVTYSTSETFTSGDAKEIYLAVTDGTQTAAIASGDAAGAATFETEVKGKADNFVPKHDGSKYTYEEKAGATGWSTATYQLTGAVNKAAEWEKGIGFPGIKVTWSWEAGEVERESAPSVNSGSAITYNGSGDFVIPYSLGAGALAATAVTDVVFTWDGGGNSSIHGTWGTPTTDLITVGSNSITIKHDGFMEHCASGSNHVLYVIFDDDTENNKSIPIHVN